MEVPTHLSQWSLRSADQAIGFLMQQAVENPGCISLAAGLVDERSLPTELVQNAVGTLLADGDSGRRLLQYGTTQGPEPLRRVYRNYLAELEGRTDGLANLPLSRLMLTTGSQQLLSLIVQAMFDPGDICLVAAPTYFVFLGVLEAAGAEIIPVDTDSNGMRPQALQKTLEHLHSTGRLGRVRLIYLVSDFENPSGVSVSADRRGALLELAQAWSRESRIYMLEDAAYRELRYEGAAPPSIWSLDSTRETVILAQTFSKSFSPGIRVGLGVLPEKLIKPVSDLKGNEDFGSAHLNQHILARVLKDGSYRRHVDSVVASYRSKRDAMLTAIDREFSGLHDVSWIRPEGGMYVWMRLPPTLQTGFDSQLFHQASRVDRVMYVPGELCYPPSWNNRPRCEMRLSFGVQSEAGIEEGIRRLACAVRTVMERISGGRAGEAMDPGTWQPACSLDVLRIRAKMLRAVREFFETRGYLEVETPCLSRDVVMDPWIEPFRVPGAGREPDRFLQTSPEAFMKRLLAAGSQSIYQVARVFRQGEFGERHNPEFTMVEWYGVGDSWKDQLAFTENLVRFCLQEIRDLNGTCVPLWPETSFPLQTYAAAFETSFGLNVHEASDLQLLHAAEKAHLTTPESGPEYSRDELLNLMFGLVIEPNLGGRRGAEAPIFLCDYPPAQAALAVITDSPTPVARRFELYMRGLELCNGYQELTDPAELLRREQKQQGIRKTLSSSKTLPGAPLLRDAMAAGLPPCSGVALGFDRLVMLATGAETLQHVLPFPADRA